MDKSKTKKNLGLSAHKNSKVDTGRSKEEGLDLNTSGPDIRQDSGDEENELVPQQWLFVHEYLKDMHGGNAAIRAGYAPASARVKASQLLATPKIKAEVQKLLREKLIKVDLSVESILMELAMILKSDLRKLYDENGRLLSPADWPDDVAAAVSGFEVEDLFDGFGDSKHQIGHTKKVKLWSKEKAIELAGRYHRLFAEKLEIEDTTKGKADRIAAARKRIHKKQD